MNAWLKIIFLLAICLLTIPASSYAYTFSRTPSDATYSGDTTFTWQETFSATAHSQRLRIRNDSYAYIDGPCHSTDEEHVDVMSLPVDGYLSVKYQDYSDSSCTSEEFGDHWMTLDGWTVLEGEEHTYYSCTGVDNACIEDAESSSYEDDPTCNSECVADVAPSITSFACNVDSFYAGGSCLLQWEIDQGTQTATAQIDQGIGNVSLNNSIRIYPIADTTYTITASSSVGSASTTEDITILTAGEAGEEMTPDQADYIIVILTTLTVITGLGLLRGLLQLFTNRR